jgi:hypothetical protein
VCHGPDSRAAVSRITTRGLRRGNQFRFNGALTY